MVKGCGFKTRCYVAGAAVRIGRHVLVGFAGGDITVVTCDAIVDDTQVIKPRARKTGGRMAGRTILGGWNVRGIGLGFFADGRLAVVARCAVIDDTGVVEYRRRERTTRHMAGTAVLSGHNVVRLGVLAGCIDTVVAGHAAGAQNSRAGVIHKRVGEV